MLLVRETCSTPSPVRATCTTTLAGPEDRKREVNYRCAWLTSHFGRGQSPGGRPPSAMTAKGYWPVCGRSCTASVASSKGGRYLKRQRRGCGKRSGKRGESYLDGDYCGGAACVGRQQDPTKEGQVMSDHISQQTRRRRNPLLAVGITALLALSWILPASAGPHTVNLSAPPSCSGQGHSSLLSGGGGYSYTFASQCTSVYLTASYSGPGVTAGCSVGWAGSGHSCTIPSGTGVTAGAATHNVAYNFDENGYVGTNTW